MFYHIADWEELDAPTFFSLALRVFAYGGVMTNIAVEHYNKQQSQQPEVLRQSKETTSLSGPAFTGLIEWSRN